MKADDFNKILNRLRASDEEAWSSIQSHMGIILSTWAKREKIELDWVASAVGIESATSVVMEVYSRFREELLSGMLKAESYSDYKRAVLTYCQEILEDQYSRFYELIRAGNNTAWQRVYERLYIYAAKWIAERKIDPDAAKDMYQDSMLTLVNNVRSKDLHFKTSREFKSYYFKILEFKAMEGNRKRILLKQKLPEMEPGHPFRPMQEAAFESDDRYFIIETIMRNSISKDEEYILLRYYFYGEKLSEIAAALHISEGNCRQKKLQVLRKIAAVYHKIEPTKQGPE